MSKLRVLNSKANYKQSTDSDLPFSIKQPVLNRGKAESTIGQTVVNLGFSVAVVNKDSFYLSVDGKLLTEGKTFDYTFTNVDVLGFSSQVTLTQAIPVANLNIQYWTVGIKPEQEYGVDSRFVENSTYLNTSLQGYVDVLSNTLTPTTAIGTPVSGTFYSTIVGRKPITDLTKDGQVRFGIKRMESQVIYQLQDEFGPNGEPVYSYVGDKYNQVRFVGDWKSTVGLDGQYISVAVGQNGFVEVTFYGTGLNILTYIAALRDYRFRVNGGVESANIATGTSTVLSGRGYSQNSIIPVVSGLPLGVYTVTIRRQAVALDLFGFEILNERTDLLIPESTDLISGKVIYALPGSTTYDSGFANTYGTPGNKGGRALIYRYQDGSIGKDIQYTDVNTLLGNAATHANEEISRVFAPREFGANRADDFSTLVNATGTPRAFTLDDGTTTLLTNNARLYSAVAGRPEGLGLIDANNSYMTITFVGTGLDITLYDTTNGGNDVHTYQVNGGASQPWFYTAGSTVLRSYKIVSGLPYGTHTVRINRVTAANWTPIVTAFTVYQPKTPALPSGTVAHAAYNLLGNYVPTTVATAEAMSAGIIAKNPTREVVYTGTWTATLNTTVQGGFTLVSNTAGNYFEYTFFGTGVDIVANVGTTGTATVSFNGINYTGAAIALGGGTWNPANSTWTLTTTNGGRLQISGLPLAKYTLRLTIATITGGFNLHTLSYITPIYSSKSLVEYDQQNTMLVGSNALEDIRNTTATKDITVKTKNIAQAVGVTSNPTNSSTVLVPVPDLSVTHVNVSGKIKVSFQIDNLSSAGNANHYYAVYVDGVKVTHEIDWRSFLAGAAYSVTGTFVILVAPGVHKVDVYGRVNLGTATYNLIDRSIIVEEI